MMRAVVQKKQKKPKRPSLPSLIAKADTLTSLYIRKKYADESGFIRCVSCGNKIHLREAHCAHFIGRSAKATRWLEENLHPACCSCNTFRKEFHMRGYTLFMLDFYGRDFIEEMRTMEKQTLSASIVRDLAEEAIAYYSNDPARNSPITVTPHYTHDSVMDAYEQIENF